MLAKRITTPTVFSGALALAALSGCSLQDYDALGAGNKTDEQTEDPDETTTDSESTSTPTSTTSESNEPDASVTNETDTSDTSETEQTSTESSSSSTTETSSTTEMVTTSDIVDTTTDQGTSETEPPPAIVTEGNLIENSSFEDTVAFGLQPGQWQVIGSAQSVPTAETSNSGTKSWMTASRSAEWNGPGINLTGLLEPDQTYVAKAWVRADTASTFHIVRKIICAFEGGVEEDIPENNSLIYQQMATAFSTGTDWVQLTSPPFTLASLRDCNHHLFVMYFEGPPPAVTLYLDDVSIVAVDE